MVQVQWFITTCMSKLSWHHVRVNLMSPRFHYWRVIHKNGLKHIRGKINWIWLGSGLESPSCSFFSMTFLRACFFIVSLQSHLIQNTVHQAILIKISAIRSCTILCNVSVGTADSCKNNKVQVTKLFRQPVRSHKIYLALCHTSDISLAGNKIPEKWRNHVLVPMVDILPNYIWSLILIKIQ